MTRKMMILLMLVASCMRRPYHAAGGSGPLSVGGFYDMTETLFSNNCGPGVLARKEIRRVKVEHTPGASLAKIIVDDRYVYDANVRADGNFAVAPARGGDARGTFGRAISGNFTATAMFARVVVDSVKPPQPTGRPLGAGDAALSQCQYTMRWDAKRL